jgi:hypothetical protein
MIRAWIEGAGHVVFQATPLSIAAKWPKFSKASPTIFPPCKYLLLEMFSQFQELFSQPQSSKTSFSAIVCGL